MLNTESTIQAKQPVIVVGLHWKTDDNASGLPKNMQMGIKILKESSTRTENRARSQAPKQLISPYFEAIHA